MQKIWVKLLYVHLHYREDRRSRIRTYKAIRCGNALYGKFRFCDTGVSKLEVAREQRKRLEILELSVDSAWESPLYGTFSERYPVVKPICPGDLLAMTGHEIMTGPTIVMAQFKQTKAVMHWPSAGFWSINRN